MIAERVVLSWIEDLQRCRRRIATEVAAHLVDFIEHQHRIVGAGSAHGLE